MHEQSDGVCAKLLTWCCHCPDPLIGAHGPHMHIMRGDDDYKWLKALAQPNDAPFTRP
jgi:hypothetical protein